MTDDRTAGGSPEQAAASEAIRNASTVADRGAVGFPTLSPRLNNNAHNGWSERAVKVPPQGSAQAVPSFPNLGLQPGQSGRPREIGAEEMAGFLRTSKLGGRRGRGVGGWQNDGLESRPWPPLGNGPKTAKGMRRASSTCGSSSQACRVKLWFELGWALRRCEWAR